MPKITVNVPPGSRVKVTPGYGRAAATIIGGALADNERRRGQIAASRYRTRFNIGDIVRMNVQGRTLLGEVVALSPPGPQQNMSVRFAGSTLVGHDELACRWQLANWRQRRAYRAAQADT